MEPEARTAPPERPDASLGESDLRVLSPEAVPPISSLLIKPASALCNLACSYCFYVERDSDPYKSQGVRTMDRETLAALVRNYLEYCPGQAVFAWQGGEPTIAGRDFFEEACRLQQRYGASGQLVSNSLQTNATLLDERWCEIFARYKFLVGVSLDGPQEVHDAYRLRRGGQGSWRRVMDSVDLLQRNGIELNVLCVVSQVNVGKAKELYRFFRGLGVEFIQYIPIAEFEPSGAPRPWSVSAQEYGRFLAETFRLWWPNRRHVRIRFFDNLAEALAGLSPGSCSLQGSCDSYCVVEHNGDVYPCDFFVRGEWKLGNVKETPFEEIARRSRRFEFASRKSLPHGECEGCEYVSICRRGCPKLREGRLGRFEDLDYFCGAYKMAFRVAVPKLRKEVERLGYRRAF